MLIEQDPFVTINGYSLQKFKLLNIEAVSKVKSEILSCETHQPSLSLKHSTDRMYSRGNTSRKDDLTFGKVLIALA